ncbi:stabilizer of axonemal microtubules 2-like [Dendronephthya gigantea]|uniref:stabilizer of axonemal microtubules 2-like n=1 Tax=Dendronephthya gigantea TaxID=151771 RepID=UPI00106B9467|nr:stabilizer of axonemal microtubules 2-like [Dendronephthya gigantea]
MATRCICQICTCGRHKCVHHPDVQVRPRSKCLLSEYRDTYRNVAVPRTMPIKPDGAPKFSNEPVEGKTTNNMTYIPHQVQPPSKREKEEYRKPQGDVEKTSSYTYDYIPHRTNPAATAKPMEKYVASQGPFDDGTTHNHTYIPWDLHDTMVKSMKPDNSLKATDGKMASKSTHQLDFPGHYGARTQPINPPAPAFRLSSAPMDGKTTTKVDYTKKDIRPRTAMKPTYEYPTDRPPLDDMTTCNRDFTWQDGKPATSFKPPAALMKSGVPFDGDTSYQNTFKQWPLTKREPREKEIYQPPATKFDGTTSFQRDYVKHPLCRAKLAKPDVYAFASKQPIDDSTEHNDAYKQWNVGLPDRVRKNDKYLAPTTKFDGRTNYQSHYTGDFAPPAEQVKPLVNARTKGDMEFKTSYKDTYKGRRPPSCPAKYLSSGPSGVGNGYMYTHAAHGHTFYRPAPTGPNEPMQTQA